MYENLKLVVMISSKIIIYKMTNLRFLKINLKTIS